MKIKKTLIVLLFLVIIWALYSLNLHRYVATRLISQSNLLIAVKIGGL